MAPAAEACMRVIIGGLNVCTLQCSEQWFVTSAEEACAAYRSAQPYPAVFESCHAAIRAGMRVGCPTGCDGTATCFGYANSPHVREVKSKSCSYHKRGSDAEVVCGSSFGVGAEMGCTGGSEWARSAREADREAEAASRARREAEELAQQEAELLAQQERERVAWEAAARAAADARAAAEAQAAAAAAAEAAKVEAEKARRAGKTRGMADRG